jgi:hypothetical protein
MGRKPLARPRLSIRLGKGHCHLMQVTCDDDPEIARQAMSELHRRYFSRRPADLGMAQLNRQSDYLK